VPDGDLLKAEALRKVYHQRGHPPRVAVDDVSFDIDAGEALAIVGESGSGKTTTARIVVGLETADGGRVTICGEDFTDAKRPNSKERRRRGRIVQMVFQDPFLSLDPRQRVEDGLVELAALHFDEPRDARLERVRALLDSVGLDARNQRAVPGGLSGGQRQRVAIARALLPEPKLLVADEAVAALDVSIQAQILNLLMEIRETSGVGYLFISHDLGVMRHVTDRAVVMKDGRVVERGRTEDVLQDPQDPYTQLLVASIPRPGWKPKRAGRIRAQTGA
jgi:ABC-type oligopeptide transport system ATPase subunit